MIKVFQAIGEKLGKVPTSAMGRVVPQKQPSNLATNATVATIQGYLRAAEAGNTKDLFALYRDLTTGGTHVQAEFGKRKLALLSQEMALLPADRNNEADQAAVEACRVLVDACENWNDGLVHLLDGCLWPVSVVEKVYRPAEAEAGLRFVLRRLSPVNPTVLCFKRPAALAGRTLDKWEEDLRFYKVTETGQVEYNAESSYEADPARHVVHRGHLLIGVPDCWGGPMRSIVFWWLLAALGRDWFARGIERYGSPFPVGKTDAQNKDAVTMLQEAFALSTKIGGLVVDHETQVELAEITASGMADAYEKFLNVCNREISKAIVGQTLSAEAQPTGLGSSVGGLHAAVREDIRQWDQVKLGETLRKQIFEPFLRLNGLQGRAPTPVWGGLDEAAAKLFAETLSTLKTSGWEPTDDAQATVSDRMGFPVQRVGAAPADGTADQAEDVTAVATDVPAGDAAAAAATGDVQATALNGAQVQALADLASQVAQGQLPVEAAKALARAAFPLVPVVLIDGIFAPLESFEPTAKASAPVAPPEPPPAGADKAPDGMDGVDKAGIRAMAARVSPTVRRRLAVLSAQDKMADELGVPGSWLNPVRDFLEELQAKAEDKNLSDADLVAFVEKAAKKVPELFKDMDVEALAKVMEAGMGEAVVGEARRKLRVES